MTLNLSLVRLVELDVPTALCGMWEVKGNWEVKKVVSKDMSGPQWKTYDTDIDEFKLAITGDLSVYGYAKISVKEKKSANPRKKELYWVKGNIREIPGDWRNDKLFAIDWDWICLDSPNPEGAMIWGAVYKNIEQKYDFDTNDKFEGTINSKGNETGVEFDISWKINMKRPSACAYNIGAHWAAWKAIKAYQKTNVTKSDYPDCFEAKNIAKAFDSPEKIVRAICDKLPRTEQPMLAVLNFKGFRIADFDGIEVKEIFGANTAYPGIGAKTPKGKTIVGTGPCIREYFCTHMATTLYNGCEEIAVQSNQKNLVGKTDSSPITLVATGDGKGRSDFSPKHYALCFKGNNGKTYVADLWGGTGQYTVPADADVNNIRSNLGLADISELDVWEKTWGYPLTFVGYWPKECSSCDKP